MTTPSLDHVTKIFSTYRFCLQANNLPLTGTMDPPGINRCPGRDFEKQKERDTAKPGGNEAATVSAPLPYCGPRPKGRDLHPCRPET